MSEIDEKIDDLRAKMVDMQDYVEHLGDRMDFLIKMSRRAATELPPPPFLKNSRESRIKAIMDLE